MLTNLSFLQNFSDSEAEDRSSIGSAADGLV